MSDSERQAGVTGQRPETELIEITPAMIRAGLDELRERCFGADLSEAVYEIYLAMEIERRRSGR